MPHCDVSCGCPLPRFVPPSLSGYVSRSHSHYISVRAKARAALRVHCRPIRTQTREEASMGVLPRRHRALPPPPPIMQRAGATDRSIDRGWAEGRSGTCGRCSARELIGCCRAVRPYAPPQARIAISDDGRTDGRTDEHPLPHFPPPSLPSPSRLQD
jgi:hypothetical protein